MSMLFSKEALIGTNSRSDMTLKGGFCLKKPKNQRLVEPDVARAMAVIL